MKFKITGKSLVELLEEYGIGEKGFYSDWWKNESFAKEKPPAGEYEIDLEEKKYTNLLYKEQKKELPEGFDFPHAAVLAEAILSYYRATDKRLMDNWYSRTNNVASGGLRVDVGVFGSVGLLVPYDLDDYRNDDLGVSSCKLIKSEVK